MILIIINIIQTSAFGKNRSKTNNVVTWVTIGMKRCIYCSLPQAPLLKQLDDGKNYYWIDLCVPGHTMN
jgi:hypothetical protein